MSTASAAPPVDAVPPKGKKKLLIIVGAAVLALVLAGGGAVFYLKSRAAAQAAAEDDEAAPATGAETVARRDPKHPPVFVPLDPFTVNLADRDAERYAQIGLSLEIEDAKEGERIKTYMPVIRNNILMVLAHKTSAELLERDGKLRLAQEIRRETARALGLDAPADEVADTAAADGKSAKKANKAPAAPLPIAAVHFSNFIIQ